MESQTVTWQTRFKDGWRGLSGLQKATVLGAGVVALAVVFYATVLAQQPDYATLFSGLSEQDAATIVDQLKTQKVPYRLTQGGTAIQVPERQVYDTRLEMAKQGLPKGSVVGFELFDGGQLGSLGMTDFMQRLQYQRALEGELARTIGSLDPVTGARVHIVVPQPSLYTSEEKDATASIVLQLKPHEELARGQVQAITHLVASSVEGLKPGNITLVDVAGNVLSTAGENSLVASSLQASSSQIEVQRSYESDLERRLQATLDQATGPGQSIVRVSAAFNWDQKQTNSETYAPVTDNAGVVRSEQIQEETNASSTTPAQGVPGQDSNTVPTYPAGGQPGTNANGYTKRNTTKNYELSKVVQTVTQAPGSLKHLSVAVLLSDKLPEDQTARLKSMLEAAAGLDPSRGDSIAVERISFAGAEPIVAEPASLVEQARELNVLGLAKVGGLLLAILLLLRFARVTFRDLSERLTTHMPTVTLVEEERLAPPAQQRLPDSQAARALPAQAEAAPMPELPPLPQELTYRGELQQLATKRPELIAELVQSWLSEG